MTGATLVIFFCIIMPITLIVLGLKLGYPVAERTTDSLLRVWDKVLPARPTLPEPPLPQIDLLDELVEAYIEAHPTNPRIIKDRQALAAWEKAEAEREAAEWRKANKFEEYQDDEDEDWDPEIEEVQNWAGKTIRKTITHRQGYGLKHSSDETCYYCERKDKWQ